VESSERTRSRLSEGTGLRGRPLPTPLKAAAGEGAGKELCWLLTPLKVRLRRMEHVAKGLCRLHEKNSRETFVPRQRRP
jgi:hypothetical protein